MIINGILGFLTWPAVILLSYFIIKSAVKKYEAKADEE